MTTFGKVFAIFVTLASLFFMGFAAVTLIGGPNYQAEQVVPLSDYVFERSSGEKPTWKVSIRNTEETVKDGLASLPAAIVEAKKHLDQKLSEQIEPLDAETPLVEARIAEAKKWIGDDPKGLDLKGLEKREKELDDELSALRAKIKEASDKYIETAAEAHAVQDETTRRRDDVFRLWNQLEEIRTDYYRALAQAEKLEDLLIRIRGSIARSQRRNKQLTPYEEKP